MVRSGWLAAYRLPMGAAAWWWHTVCGADHETDDSRQCILLESNWVIAESFAHLNLLLLHHTAAPLVRCCCREAVETRLLFSAIGLRAWPQTVLFNYNGVLYRYIVELSWLVVTTSKQHVGGGRDSF